MNRSELQRLAELRLSDAHALFAAHAYEGSYYLAGYAIECALKACIAKRTREFDFPDKREVERSYTHDLERLLEVVDRDRVFAKTMDLDANLSNKWKTVIEWSEKSRYMLDLDEESAQNMLVAVDGVLRWLKTFW